MSVASDNLTSYLTVGLTVATCLSVEKVISNQIDSTNIFGLGTYTIWTIVYRIGTLKKLSYLELIIAPIWNPNHKKYCSSKTFPPNSRILLTYANSVLYLLKYIHKYVHIYIGTMILYLYTIFLSILLLSIGLCVKNVDSPKSSH